ncbi:MAG TPA: alpha/beta fold hydrolase [Trichocoleus sp.]
MIRIRRKTQAVGNLVRRLGWLSLGTGLAQLLGLTLQGVGCGFGQPALAAERIIVAYGPAERSIQVEDLETFAQTGQLSRQLSEYIQMLGLSPNQVAQFQEALNTRIDINAIAVGQFLYTAQGKFLLKQVAQVVQTPSRRAGFSATRAALILAASDQDQGLTILNVLRYFPTESVRVDVRRGLAIAGILNETLVSSSRAIEAIQTQSETVTAQTPPEVLAALTPAYSQLRAQQLYDVEVFDFFVPGVVVPALFYMPQPKSGTGASPFSHPLVVISHGLGSDREAFDYLARYLAGAGIAVVSVEHTGSNAGQLFSLLEGRANLVTPTEEFIDRPRTISRTLDALEQETRRNVRLARRLDLSRIGVIGQSFGGYTALALAGATIDFTYLGEQCSPTTLNLNVSLLLQCEATLLTNPGNSLVDPRIRAVFVMNPIGSALFGPNGYAQIDVPIMMVAGAGDTIAPAFPEQINPFTWLTTPDRYLLLVGNGTHFSVIENNDNEQPIPVPPAVIGPRPDIAQEYMKVLSLAFFGTYLQGNAQFRSLLQPAFVQSLGVTPLPLSLVQDLSTLPVGTTPPQTTPQAQLPLSTESIPMR